LSPVHCHLAVWAQMQSRVISHGLVFTEVIRTLILLVELEEQLIDSVYAVFLQAEARFLILPRIGELGAFMSRLPQQAAKRPRITGQF